MIKVENVRFSYGREEILKGIDVCFEKNEICAITGLNGCGKTTLLRLLVGLEQSESGKISIDGKDIRQYRGKELARKISFFPQNRPVPEMTVADYVANARFPYLKWDNRLSKDDKEKIEEAVRIADVSAFAQRDIRELSGGERQRVYMAMLLAQDTPYVLLDEPTAYLDISQQFCMMETMKRLRENGKCVIAVVHDLASAFKYCDKVAVMDGGRISAYGEAGKVAESEAIEKTFGVVCDRVEINGNAEYVFRPKH